MFDTIDSIRQAGFDGFTPISKLQKLTCEDVPEKFGIYCILTTSMERPRFLVQSIGGHFKGRNPTVPVSVLDQKWVDGSVVLYIGKAGPTARRTLRKRLTQYLRFGHGEPVAHWGGRYIWQLPQSADLLVCWKPTPDVNPRMAESELIRQFENIYHKLPFANCVR